MKLIISYFHSNEIKDLIMYTLIMHAYIKNINADGDLYFTRISYLCNYYIILYHSKKIFKKITC